MSGVFSPAHIHFPTFLSWQTIGAGDLLQKVFFAQHARLKAWDGEQGKHNA